MMAVIYRFEDGQPIKYSLLKFLYEEFAAVWLGFFGSLIVLGLVAWLYYGG